MLHERKMLHTHFSKHVIIPNSDSGPPANKAWPTLLHTAAHIHTYIPDCCVIYPQNTLLLLCRLWFPRQHRAFLTRKAHTNSFPFLHNNQTTFSNHRTCICHLEGKTKNAVLKEFFFKC